MADFLPLTLLNTSSRCCMNDNWMDSFIELLNSLTSSASSHMIQETLFFISGEILRKSYFASACEMMIWIQRWVIFIDDDDDDDDDDVYNIYICKYKENITIMLFVKSSVSKCTRVTWNMLKYISKCAANNTAKKQSVQASSELCILDALQINCKICFFQFFFCFFPIAKFFFFKHYL